eukprot:573494-Pelagomonas_calceolata.AAC.1
MEVGARTNLFIRIVKERVTQLTTDCWHALKDRGLQEVGPLPKNLADQLQLKQSHLASNIESNSDKNFENLYKS